MKQKIITIVTGLAAIGFLGKDKIMSYVNKDTNTEQSAPAAELAAQIEIDTILENSMKNITHAGENNAKSDSIIVTKVDKTAKNIEVLHKEVKILKKENNELKARLHDTDGVNQHFGLLPIATEAPGE